MSKSCPYCAQTNTRKDKYGYCRRYCCFFISGTKEEYEKLQQQLRNTIFLPRYKQNQFDGIAYNPQKENQSWIRIKIQNLLGFLPLEDLS